MTGHHERLLPPPSWWAGAAAFAVVWGWLLLVLSGTVPGLLTAAGVGAVVAVALWRYGTAAVVSVDHGVLRAGRARIDLQHLDGVEVLDRAAMRRWHGPDADARAWLVHRTYVAGGVRATVSDPSDPTPYWLLSSRRPDDLARALTSQGVPTTTSPDEEDLDGADEGDTDGAT